MYVCICVCVCVVKHFVLADRVMIFRKSGQQPQALAFYPTAEEKGSSCILKSVVHSLYLL